MIARLTGLLTFKTPEALIVDVQGVGYELFVTRKTFERLPELGSAVTLCIYTHVQEGAITLYGFSDLREKNLFRKLISVSGIGPKLATQVLSGMHPEELIASILKGDIVNLTRINGVGKKTAERLIVELKDKMLEFMEPGNPIGVSASTMVFSGKDLTYQEALSALMNLGYSRPIAEKALTAVPIHPHSTVEEVLKGSLGVLGR